MWCRAVVLCCLVAVALGALAHGPLFPKPDKYKDIQGCYIPALDNMIPYGEARPAKDSCMEYRCYSDEIVYVSCGKVAAGPGVKIVEDKSKPYPDCCPKLVKAQSTTHY